MPSRAGRYAPEFERVVAPIYERDATIFGAAVRLALLREIVAEGQWDALRDVVIGDLSEDVVPTLQVRGVLDERELRVPSYGHSTRHEAVMRWLIERYAPSVRQQTERLAERLAASIGGVDAPFHPRIIALELCDRPWARRPLHSVRPLSSKRRSVLIQTVWRLGR